MENKETRWCYGCDEVKPLEKKSTIRKIKEVKSKRITPKTESDLEPKKKKRKRKKKTNEDNK